MSKGALGGKYGNGEAGIRHHLHPKDWGTKREFVGSGISSYFFKLDNGTILIIRADNYRDALYQARSRGAKRYTRTSKK